VDLLYLIVGLQLGEVRLDVLGRGSLDVLAKKREYF
jgi:hypothetical protein